MELDAGGNSVLEGLNFDGQNFSARAAHIRYAEAKDLVVLEGDGQVNAQLSRQERVGAPIDRTLSRKLHYWVSTRRVYVDDAQHLDMQMLSNPRQARAPNGQAAPR
jgi:hypothetical protein